MMYIKWAMSFLRDNKKAYIWGLSLSVLVCTPLLLLSPVVLSFLIDDVFTRQNYDSIFFLSLLYLLFIVVRMGVHYLAQFLIESSSQKTTNVVRDTIFEKLQSLTPSFYANTRTGNLMTNITGDCEHVLNFLFYIAPSTVNTALLIIGSITAFFIVSYKLALIILIIAPLATIISIKTKKSMREAYTVFREKLSNLNSVTQENLAGNRVVKAFVREEYELEKFGKKNSEYRDCAIEAGNIWSSVGPFVSAFAGSLDFVALLGGGYLLIAGELTLGQLSLFLSLNWAVAESMRVVGVIINDFQRFASSAEKLMLLNYTKPDIVSPRDAVSIKNPKGNITFDKVCFNFGKTQILKDISMTVKSGETIGIMGPTGAGKTTLVNLLLRFMDVTSGEILIDGVNIKELSIFDLRRLVSCAFQDVFLFSNTVSKNIAYGNSEMPDEDIEDCAASADAHGFIKKLPDGYDTVVGERGVGLSGGQKQRISLARALAYNFAPILILDDVTSAVDLETELYIEKELREKKKDVSKIIIAQRVSAVVNADKIFIIENGEITECGSHEELLANKGYYYDTFVLQSGQHDETGVSAHE